jgi:hypothetical protein
MKNLSLGIITEEQAKNILRSRGFSEKQIESWFNENVYRKHPLYDQLLAVPTWLIYANRVFGGKTSLAKWAIFRSKDAETIDYFMWLCFITCVLSFYAVMRSMF